MWWKALVAAIVGAAVVLLLTCGGIKHNVDIDHKMKIEGNINHNHNINIPQNIEIRGPLGGRLGNIHTTPPDDPKK
jgi:hypothetical protein